MQSALMSLKQSTLLGEGELYSARFGLSDPASAVMKKDLLIWCWKGSHAEYNRLV